MADWQLTQAYDFSEGQVRYDVLGAGPPVVLVHGTPWSAFSWRKVAAGLAQSRRVHLYDFIGYGLSEKRAGQEVSLAVQNRLLAELLDHWGLAAPDIVGHDFGGATVLRTHLLGGRDFRRMALVNAVAMAPWGSPFFGHVREHEAAFAGVPAYIHKAIVEAYIKTALHGDMAAESFAGLVAPWLGDQGQAAFYRQIAQADQRHTDEVEPRYGEIRCPVLILWGENDSWIPIETGRRLHQAIPGARFQPIPGAGHLAQEDRPEVILQALERFFA